MAGGESQVSGQHYLCFSPVIQHRTTTIRKYFRALQHCHQVNSLCGNERSHQDDRKYILSGAQVVRLLVNAPLPPDYPYSSVTFVSLLSSLPPALMATIQNKVNLSSFTSAGLNTGAPFPGLESFYHDQAQGTGQANF